MAELEFKPGSLLGPVDETQIKTFTEWFRANDNPEFKFDTAFLSHIRSFHGGVPKKRCFVTPSGRTRMIDRFLNFVDCESDEPNSCYNIEVVWSQIEERLNRHLMPFACLFGGDMVCFNDEKPGRPTIVVWEHEKSAPRTPCIELVANDFDSFFEKLIACPKD
jgi:hypothetical protein